MNKDVSLFWRKKLIRNIICKHTTIFYLIVILHSKSQIQSCTCTVPKAYIEQTRYFTLNWQHAKNQTTDTRNQNKPGLSAPSVYPRKWRNKLQKNMMTKESVWNYRPKKKKQLYTHDFSFFKNPKFPFPAKLYHLFC